MADPAEDTPYGAAPADAADDVIDQDGDSIVDQVKDLADDVRTAVEAEIAWQRARASIVGGQVAGIAAWGGFALVCGFIAVFASAFGAILVLTPVVGALLATAVVTGALLLAALIGGLVVRSRVRRLKTVAFPANSGATR